MMKKIVYGILFISVIGLLIFGAINRTIAKSETPIASGLNRSEQINKSVTSEDLINNGGIGLERNNKGKSAQTGNFNKGNCEGEAGYYSNNNKQSQRFGQGGNNNSGTIPSEIASTVSQEGRVESATEEALAITTVDGHSLVIEGRAWRYALENGYTIQAGEQVRITGFYEDGEFKVVTLSLKNGDGEFSFRQNNGHPNWAGGGQGGRGNRNNT